MTAALAAIVAAGIVLPHALPLQRVTPVTAVVLWLSSLALRATVCVLGVIALFYFLPGTGLFVALTHWCADVGPGVEGHGVGALALYLAPAALAASLVVMGVAGARDARAARVLVSRHAVGLGPRNSLIVGGSDVLFAVAGVVRPRIVVSAGALASLDDGELTAALDHEAGHIARRHRFVMLLAMGLHAAGRLVPGGARGLRELAFHLERDADRWALRRHDDRVALASVICQAATGERTRALVGLGDTDVRERVGQVLGRSSGATRRARTAFNALAAAMAVCTVAAAASVPAAAVAGARADAHRGHHRHHCQHGAAVSPPPGTAAR